MYIHLPHEIEFHWCSGPHETFIHNIHMPARLKDILTLGLHVDIEIAYPANFSSINQLVFRGLSVPIGVQTLSLPSPHETVSCRSGVLSFSVLCISYPILQAKPYKKRYFFLYKSNRTNYPKNKQQKCVYKSSVKNEQFSFFSSALFLSFVSITFCTKIVFSYYVYVNQLKLWHLITKTNLSIWK